MYHGRQKILKFLIIKLESINGFKKIPNAIFYHCTLMATDVMGRIGTNISVIYQNQFKLISILLIFQGLENLRERDLHQELKNSQKKNRQ
jgi:hypothetical protein